MINDFLGVWRFCHGFVFQEKKEKKKKTDVELCNLSEIHRRRNRAWGTAVGKSRPIVTFKFIFSTSLIRCTKLQPFVVFICCLSLRWCSSEESDPTVSAKTKQQTPVTEMLRTQLRPCPSTTLSGFPPGMGLLRHSSCHSSSVGGAAVCGHPPCLQLDWIAAQHWSDRGHWRAFCFTRNTSLIHSAQWDCSQLFSLRNEGKGVGKRVTKIPPCL